jgi:hypothetical protein
MGISMLTFSDLVIYWASINLDGKLGIAQAIQHKGQRPSVNNETRVRTTRAQKLFIALISLIAPILTRADILAGPIINPLNGHHYYLLSENTWTASQAEARALGGNLATVRSAEENQWIVDTFSTFGGTNRQLWIGLNDLQQAGQWRWASGEPVTYVNWAPGEPNFIGEERFVFIYGPGIPYPAGNWNNEYDRSILESWGESGHFYGVVEIDPHEHDPLRVEIRVASVAVRWNSLSNKQYQVQYASTLEPTVWFDLGSPVQGTGTNNVVFDFILDAQQQRFYRVIVLP